MITFGEKQIGAKTALSTKMRQRKNSAHNKLLKRTQNAWLALLRR